MKIKILGCSGGIGGKRRTTSILVDDDILIDAGTGVMDLSINQLAKINHIFLTHCHLDHICSIPLLADTVMGIRTQPINIYTLKETENILREHIFNWKIWPDFTKIPDNQNPILRFETISVGETINLDGRKISPLSANHTVPAIGFLLEGLSKSLVFTGDTTYCEELWAQLNQLRQLDYLIIESAMDNQDQAVAELAKHFFPKLLQEKLQTLDVYPEILITHLKPNAETKIKNQLRKVKLSHTVQFLTPHMILEI